MSIEERTALAKWAYFGEGCSFKRAALIAGKPLKLCADHFDGETLEARKRGFALRWEPGINGRDGFLHMPGTPAQREAHRAAHRGEVPQGARRPIGRLPVDARGTVVSADAALLESALHQQELDARTISALQAELTKSRFFFFFYCCIECFNK
jgi:hypothetical protein